MSPLSQWVLWEGFYRCGTVYTHCPQGKVFSSTPGFVPASPILYHHCLWKWGVSIVCGSRIRLLGRVYGWLFRKMILPNCVSDTPFYNATTVYKCLADVGQLETLPPYYKTTHTSTNKLWKINLKNNSHFSDNCWVWTIQYIMWYLQYVLFGCTKRLKTSQSQGLEKGCFLTDQCCNTDVLPG